jgi:hypothetical protein
MKRLLYKGIILFSPLIILMFVFIGLDPMKVFKSYDNPVEKGVLMNDRLFKIRYLKTTNTRYNSFILGSSRSNAFKIDNWLKVLNDSNAIGYHLGVNDETLYGMYGKINFLNDNNCKIKNVFILLDNRVLSLTKNHKAHVFAETPEITGETKIEFYKDFLFAFLDPLFLKEYFSYMITNQVKNEGQRLWDPGFTFNKVTGDIFYSRMDSLIAKDSVEYYIGKKSVFYSREQIIEGEQKGTINKDGSLLLNQIMSVLKTHNSNYKLVITPNYDQIPICKSDLKIINEIFGKENVYDFSGINEITQETGNYYEERHFKPSIADSIMHLIY